MNRGVILFLTLGILICLFSFLFMIKILNDKYMLKFFISISFIILIYILYKTLLDYLKKK